MTDLPELLKERNATHGDYSVHAEITQRLKDVLRQSDGWSRLTLVQRESLDMIAHKLGRIAAGNPNHQDHWVDIGGYSQLVAEALEEGS
jgi:hypothetical protein